VSPDRGVQKVRTPVESGCIREKYSRRDGSRSISEPSKPNRQVSPDLVLWKLSTPNVLWRDGLKLP